MDTLLMNRTVQSEVSVDIQNFKSIHKTRMQLKPGLNILVGPNGSGKTCVLGALKFIRDVLQLGSAHALARSGGAKRVYRRGTKRMTFGVVQEYGLRSFKRKRRPFTLFWEFSIKQSGPEGIAAIVNERIIITAVDGDRPKEVFSMEIDRNGDSKTKKHISICKAEDMGRDMFSEWQAYFGSESKREVRKQFMGSMRAVLREAERDKDRSLLFKLVVWDRAIEQLYGRFGKLNEYNIVPDVAREATEQLQFARMHSNGGAVAEVIYALEKKHFHRIWDGGFEERIEGFWPGESPGWGSYYHYERKRYRRFLRERPAAGGLDRVLKEVNLELSAAVKELDSVAVEIDPTSGKRFVVFRSGKDTFYPDEVSDGTMKWLCLLISIFVPYLSVYLLEEPENFLHPWMQQRVAAIMREQAAKTGTVFVLTSHSATMLNAAQPDELVIVRQTRSGTVLSGVAEKSDLARVLDKSDFGLGDLWVSGALGGVPTDG